MTAGSLFINLFVSSIGFAFFIYGKKQSRFPQLVGGIALMAYPYFITDVWIMLGVGVVILAGMWLAMRFGM